MNRDRGDSTASYEAAPPQPAGPLLTAPVNKRLLTDLPIEALMQRLQRSSETAVIGLRVPKYIKLIYDSLNASEKRIVKDIFIEALKGYVESTGKGAQNVSVNVSIVLQAPSAGVVLNGDDRQVLRELVDWLERVSQPHMEYPKRFKEVALKALPVLKKLLFSPNA